METPRVEVAALGCRLIAGAVQHPGEAVRWQVTWLVHNAGAQPLELEAAWIPHGRFRGDGRLPLSGQIGPGTAHQLEFSVTADEAPGTVVDNAFLILRVRVGGQPWRIFVRMRIEFNAAAVPGPVIEAITTQSLE